MSQSRSATTEITTIQSQVRYLREEFLTPQCSDFTDRLARQPFLLGIICGSGFDALAELLDNPTELLAYSQVPGLLAPTVSGHSGGFVAGTIAGFPVLIACGRSHLYEGHHPWETVRLTRVMGLLCQTMMTTAFVGSPVYKPGTAVLVGNVNTSGVMSPLIGSNLEALTASIKERKCPRFPGMRHPFHPRLQRLVRDAAAEAPVSMVLKDDLKQGLRRVVGSGYGPHYETQADVDTLLDMGVHLLNMGSLIIESMVYRHMGVPLVGIAGVGNWATGYGPDGRINLEEESFSLGHDEDDVDHEEGMKIIRQIVTRDLIPLLPVYVRLLAAELG